MKTLRKPMLLFLIVGLLFALCAGTLAIGAAAEETEDVPSATTVSDEDLQSLSMDGGALSYSIKSGGTITVRLTPDSSDEDYTLVGVTDFAFRFKVVHRQTNRPNTGSGLAYMRVKFEGSDTIWGITKENKGGNMQFTFIQAATGEKSSVRVSDGGDNAVGGQINVAVGTDGTMYVPLTQIRDGNMKTELGNRLTDTQGYEDLKIEYIEFTYSGSRWDFAFGQFAAVRRTNDAVETDVLSFTPSIVGTNAILLDSFYDNVALVVNGAQATKTADGKLEAETDYGKVYIDSDKLFYFDPVTVKTELDEGYGITKVETSIEGKQLAQTTEAGNSSSLSEGYVYQGEYYFRKGNHGAKADDNTFMSSGTGIFYPENDQGKVLESGTDLLGAEPLNCTISVTVEQLECLTVTGESGAVDVAYGTQDTSAADGKVYLKSGESALITVTPKTGYDFRGVKLNGEDLELTDENKTVDVDSGRITLAKYTITISEASELEILGLGDEVTLGLDIGTTGGSLKIDGAAVTGTEFASNVFKTLAIEPVPETGYAAKVSIVYPAEGGTEEIVTELTVSQTDGKYYYQVDKAFTVKVEFEVVTYSITYRLNGGEYASGESNPETITYFETVTLKNVAKDGYDFKGWRIEGQEDYITQLAEINSDITVIAVFEMSDQSGKDPDEQDPDKEQGGETETGKSGCGSSVFGVSALGALLVTAGAVIVLVRKKGIRS